MFLSSPLFLIPLITGPVFIMAGLVMMKFPPKEINSIYGYRTPRSMKSQERWDFAQGYSARKMLIAGIILTLFSPFGLVIVLQEIVAVIVGISLTIIAAAVPIVLTEMELRSRFAQKV